MDLQDILDRTAIRDAITDYTFGIDLAEWDRLDRVFTPDAAINYVESGGIEAGFAEIKPWLIENLAVAPSRVHMIGQIDYEALPDGEIQANAYFHNPMTFDFGEQKFPVEVTGIYRHTFTRTADGWRSRKLHETVLWRRGFEALGM
ncbi:nuclear transport factor 2 family protein [Nocardioides marmoriginsengisoli]|uniref:Nuclear transport factor 2 family protein n=1 Tax=Nocardioides marmoriginsengisoli TaxID=661483 RepID=A0A3N0CAI0_9ACTN|nr:nuclear transport factor 2 family protein [Nocardioides marmoriginsengisoli]RNL60460.1 nuclear transport factor 2 family protein [Nocardioides marmoriginsengisoli]